MSVLPISRRVFLTCVLSTIVLTVAPAQVNFTGPQPGDVYREFSRAMPATGDTWRVTDPNINLGVYPQADPFVPNPRVPLTVSDLQGATRVEAVISLWGGHIGTTGKKVRFNNNSWITIPELGSQNGIPAGHNGQCYINEVTVTVNVPLAHLITGTNYFEGTNTGQTCYNFGWGQHGWYNLMLRVYYNPSQKSHPTGRISTPSTGGTIGENPTVAATVTGGSVDRIDFLASYYGYDTDGDGVYTGYHYDYHPASVSEGSMNIRNHVGTATGSSRQVTWNTQWVPDQAQGGIRLLARMRDASGVWYCTEEVTGLSLSRAGSVKLYVSSTLRERAWARGDLPVVTSTVTIPSSESVADATAAVYHNRTWNGIDSAREPGETHYRRFNGWTDGEYGDNHFYSYDVRTVPINQLKQGTNTFSFYSETTKHHGIEILWPGPALTVRYGSAPSSVPPSITAHPSNQTIAEGETATFTVAATGSSPLAFQWQKNSSDISGATGASYTTPVVAAADSGSRYRCVVANPHGTATSNEGLLSVIRVLPPSITADPTPKTVLDGQPASFSVTATGTAPLTFQWQKNAVNIAGANGSTYNIAAAVYADSGALFRCIVSNLKGADTSNSALLSVTAVAPAIITHPANQQVSVGDTATFTVIASGSLPRSYEWLKDGSPIPGANAASYSIVAATADSGAAFRCRVTNGAGSVTSDPGYLIVGTFPPTITAHPVQAFVGLNETATFSVTATGTKPLTYQWQRDSVDIPGANAPSYTTPPIVSDDNGRSYRCVVTNDYGTDTSEAAILSVTSDALNMIANGGFELGTVPWVFYSNGSASFANDSAGPQTPHAAHLAVATPGDNVQLYQTKITLDRDTSYTLLFKAYSSSGHDFEVNLHKHVSPYTNYGLAETVFDLATSWKDFRKDFTAAGFSGTANDGRLRFWLSPYDATGDRFFIDDVVLVKTSTLVAPTITRQPLGTSAKEGETATFSVVVSGTTPFTYQWEKNLVAITGANSASYTTPPVTLADHNVQFRCVVTNLVGSVTSDPALLSIVPLDVKQTPEQPKQFYLAQNHPNPFNPSTVIRFGLPTGAHVTIKVNNLLGQEVRTLVDEFLVAGTHQITFRADGLPSGMYLYRMQSGSFIATKKLVLIK